MEVAHEKKGMLVRVNCLSTFDSGEQKWSAARSDKSSPPPNPVLCALLCFLSQQYP